MTFTHKYGIYSVISLSYVLRFVGGEKGQRCCLREQYHGRGREGGGDGETESYKGRRERGWVGGGGEGLVPIWLNHKEYRGQLFVEEIKLGSQAIL